MSDYSKHFMTGTESSNIEDRSKMSPDERQAVNDSAYSSSMDALASRDLAPPLPRPDPRNLILDSMGRGMTHGEFDQSLAEDGWVNAKSENMKSKTYYKQYGFFGDNIQSPFSDEHDPNAVDHARFLLDTFKRARSTGVPIHPLTPLWDPRPADKFTTEGYDY